jgi:hypothetical protein
MRMEVAIRSDPCTVFHPFGKECGKDGRPYLCIVPTWIVAVFNQDRLIARSESMPLRALARQRGLMMKEAVGEGAAELLVEEDEEQGDLGSFVRQPTGASLSIACEQPMSF